MRTEGRRQRRGRPWAAGSVDSLHGHKDSLQGLTIRTGRRTNCKDKKGLTTKTEGRRRRRGRPWARSSINSMQGQKDVFQGQGGLDHYKDTLRTGCKDN